MFDLDGLKRALANRRARAVIIIVLVIGGYVVLTRSFFREALEELGDLGALIEEEFDVFPSALNLMTMGDETTLEITFTDREVLALPDEETAIFAREVAAFMRDRYEGYGSLARVSVMREKRWFLIKWSRGHDYSTAELNQAAATRPGLQDIDRVVIVVTGLGEGANSVGLSDSLVRATVTPALNALGISVMPTNDETEGPWLAVSFTGGMIPDGQGLAYYASMLQVRVGKKLVRASGPTYVGQVWYGASLFLQPGEGAVAYVESELNAYMAGFGEDYHAARRLCEPTCASSHSSSYPHEYPALRDIESVMILTEWNQGVEAVARGLDSLVPTTVEPLLEDLGIVVVPGVVGSAGPWLKVTFLFLPLVLPLGQGEFYMGSIRTKIYRTVTDDNGAEVEGEAWTNTRVFLGEPAEVPDLVRQGLQEALASLAQEREDALERINIEYPPRW